MAVRVTPGDVKEILASSTVLDESDIRVWIDIANLVITRYAALCTDAGAATLAAMEKLLTAHLITATVERGQSVTSRSFGDSSETYGLIAGEGLRSTTYGQQLTLLDPCGQLQNYGKPRAYSSLL